MSRPSPVLKTLMLSIGQMQAQARRAPKDPVAATAIAASTGIAHRALQNLRPPMSHALRAAAILSGQPDLHALARLHATSGPITLSPKEWTLALRANDPETMMALVRGHVVEARGAAVAIMGQVANGRKRLDGMLMDISAYTRDLSALKHPYRALLGQVAPLAAGFLRDQVARNTASYQSYAQSVLINGDALGVAIIHKAGLDLDAIAAPHTASHPKAQWLFNLRASHHAQIAFAAHARTLEHLLTHQQAFQDWRRSLAQ